MRPQSLVDIVSHVRSGSEFQSAVKEFLDEVKYRRARGISIYLMYADQPELLGNAVEDVYLAGLAEFLAFKDQAVAPDWTEAPERYLSEPVYAGGRNARGYMLRHTSFSLRKRLLFCGEIEL